MPLQYTMSVTVMMAYDYASLRGSGMKHQSNIGAMRQYHMLDHNWQHTSPASLIKGLSILWYRKNSLGVHVRQKCIIIIITGWQPIA